MTIYRRQLGRDKLTLQHLPPRHAGELFDRWLDHVVESEGGIVGFDVETTAIDDVLGPFEPGAQLRMVQFGSRRYGWALDAHDDYWRERIEEVLDDPEIRKVSHTNYDVLWAGREFGTPADARFIDTIIMAALLFPGVTQPKDLKALTGRYISRDLIDAETALLVRFKELRFDQSKLPKSFVAGESKCRKPGCIETSEPGSLRGLCFVHHWSTANYKKADKAWGFTNIDLADPAFGEYGALDAIFVRRLLDILSAMLKARNDPKLMKLSRREQRMQRTATQMRQRGLLVDAEWAADLLADVEHEHNDAADRLVDLWGFPVGSPKRGEWLEVHGAEFVDFTPTGQAQLTMPSASSPGTLPGLAQRYADDSVLGPIFADMVTVSSHKNFLTNLHIIEASARNDGFVHPEIKILAAHTGRQSVIKPALQTLKKRDPRLRGCFVSVDGHVLVGADYAGQENRIAAAYSRDEALLRIVENDLSQHMETNKMIFGCDNKVDVMEKVTGKTFYDASKTLDFAQQYGAGPARIGDQLGMPRVPCEHDGYHLAGDANPKAVKMWKAWRRAYAGLVEWTESLSDKKLIINPWGRLLPADTNGAGEIRRGYANGNYVIQSTGRDLLGDAVDRLINEGWGQYFWLFIHDEIILEVPESMAEEAAAALTRIMSTTFKGVSIPAEGKIIGYRWGADGDD